MIARSKGLREWDKKHAKAVDITDIKPDGFGPMIYHGKDGNETEIVDPAVRAELIALFREGREDG